MMSKGWLSSEERGDERRGEERKSRRDYYYFLPT